MTKPAPNSQSKHWLVRPAMIRKLWIAFVAILALTVGSEFLFELHPHFEIEATFGFNAWYGLLTCVAMVLAAKVLGFVLKRRDDYYEPDEDRAENRP